MTVEEVTQLVAFRTDLPVDRFTTTWRPVAAGFLAQGLSTITLAASTGDEQDDGDGIRFLSRNTWPAEDYHRTFPGGIAADAGAGAVTVRQAGVFAVDPAGARPVAAARPDRDLSVALLHLTDPEQAGAAVEALLTAVPHDASREPVAYQGLHRGQRYHVAVTVHGPSGTGTASTAALRSAARACPAEVGRAVFLTGRELLSLVP